MKLVETNGKQLLRQAGIEIPEGVVFSLRDAAPDLGGVSFPCFVKAQVPEGRRGKRGLVIRCASAEDVQPAYETLREKLADRTEAIVLIEPETVHAEEWLVSLDIDGTAGAVRLTVSSHGGMHVANVDSHLISSTEHIAKLALPDAVAEVVKKAFGIFRSSDILSLEINPLAVLEDGRAIALDAKIEVDDAAQSRHPEWETFFHVETRSRSEREAEYARRQESAGHRGTMGRYIELDGDIAMILSGGGASLAATDALRAAGGSPANYVEMSGNPDPERVRAACRVVFSKPGLKAVWVAGSHANFTDIQATVMATLAAYEDCGLHVPVVIRRDGPNAQAARDEAGSWAKERGVTLRFDLSDVDFDTSARAVVQAISV